MIAVTEVFPKSCRYKPTLAELNIDGYECHVNEEGHRGVALYIKNEISATRVHLDTNYEESVWAKCKLNKTDKLLIGVIYRSPNSSEENNERLNDSFRKLSNTDYSHILIMGDFNFPGIIWPEGMCSGPSEAKIC